jgi:hypothetical protein
MQCPTPCWCNMYYCVFVLWKQHFTSQCLFVWTFHFALSIRPNSSLYSVHSSEQVTSQCLFVWTFHVTMPIRLNVSLCTVHSSEQFTLHCPFVWTFHFAVFIRLNTWSQGDNFNAIMRNCIEYTQKNSIMKWYTRVHRFSPVSYQRIPTRFVEPGFESPSCFFALLQEQSADV